PSCRSVAWPALPDAALYGAGRARRSGLAGCGRRSRRLARQACGCPHRGPNLAGISDMMPLGAGEVMLRSSRAGPWVMAKMRLSAFAAAVAVALLAAPAGAQVRWSLPSAYPADNFHSENLDTFAQEVAQATAGKRAIKTYPNASLSPATAIKSAVRIGQAQMGEILISVHDNEDPMFGIDVVPFLAASYGEARKLWAASKPAI